MSIIVIKIWFYTMLQGLGQVQLIKYSSTLSIQNIYQVQVLVKYSFFQEVLNTSSTFISSYSTSTSTHIKIFHWSLISIPWYIYVMWIKERDLPQIISFLKTRWIDILYDTEQRKCWMDKIKGLYLNHVFVQKSRWPYSM